MHQRRRPVQLAGDDRVQYGQMLPAGLDDAPLGKGPLDVEQPPEPVLLLDRLGHEAVARTGGDELVKLGIHREEFEWGELVWWGLQDCLVRTPRSLRAIAI